MKQLTFTMTVHENRATAVVVVSDDDHGGNAVPGFGKTALRMVMLYLEETSTRAINGELEFVTMISDGRSLEELKAERANNREALDHDAT